MNENDLPEAEPTPEADAPPQVNFRDLTLYEVLLLTVFRPLDTLTRLFREITPPEEAVAQAEPSAPRREYAPPPPRDDFDEDEPPIEEEEDTLVGIDESDEWQTEPLEPLAQRRDAITAGGLLLTIALAIVGGSRLWRAALVQDAGLKGAPVWFWLAGMVYLAVTIFVSLGWWRALLEPKPAADDLPAEDEPPDSVEEDAEDTEPIVPQKPSWITALSAWISAHGIRLALIPVGIVLAYLAYRDNVTYRADGQVRDVVLTRAGGIAWGLAILTWYGVLAVDLNGFFNQMWNRQRARQSRTRWPRPRVRWQHGILLLALALGLFFRLDQLNSVPPEMTSDHIEKLLDSVRVYNGHYAVFFPNNGGREAFQMYAVAGLVRFFGQDFSFQTLKLATIIEGMLTILAGYWLGIAVMGNKSEQHRLMGIWLGLTFALLLAISSWHTMLSRLGLRIALTPLTTVLVLILLARAMRHNRRRDFVLMGMMLGAGTYFYQANRILPVLVVIGTLLAVVVYARRWQEAGRYVVNLGCTAIIAFVIFLPMLRYGQEFPKDFWNRTRGRLFGENAFIRQNPDTGLEETYEPGIREQVERFGENFDVFQENYKDALLMWSWQGDGAWINNGESRPALDPYTDGLFILGILAWTLLILRDWDMVHLLIPLGMVVMLLPSALTLAYQIENPSFTRASGSLPMVFLIAAFPLAQLGYYAQRAVGWRLPGALLSLALMMPLIGLAAAVNHETYFDVYQRSYAASWKPYSIIAEPLESFAQNEGSYGNAFMIAWPHWLDHRILGTDAGDIHWPNGLVNREDLFSFLLLNADTPYAYDPDKPLFFMYNMDDTDTEEWLREVFPDGVDRVETVAGRPELDFKVYIAPPHQDFDRLRAEFFPGN